MNSGIPAVVTGLVGLGSAVNSTLGHGSRSYFSFFCVVAVVFGLSAVTRPKAPTALHRVLGAIGILMGFAAGVLTWGSWF